MCPKSKYLHSRDRAAPRRSEEIYASQNNEVNSTQVPSLLTRHKAGRTFCASRSIPPRKRALRQTKLDTSRADSVALLDTVCAGVAQGQSKGLIIPRPWVRVPPPAPNSCAPSSLDSHPELSSVLTNQIAAIVLRPAYFTAPRAGRHVAIYNRCHHLSDLVEISILASRRKLGSFQAEPLPLGCAETRGKVS
jgi:hypothetical protein